MSSRNISAPCADGSSNVYDSQLPPAPKVRRARAAGIATALVSDAHEVPAAVAALFDAVVLGPALGVRKPDPEVFRRAAAQLGLSPAECVVVDDHPAAPAPPGPSWCATSTRPRPSTSWACCSASS